jgi:hypothetical protein
MPAVPRLLASHRMSSCAERFMSVRSPPRAPFFFRRRRALNVKTTRGWNGCAYAEQSRGGSKDRVYVPQWSDAQPSQPAYAGVERRRFRLDLRARPALGEEGPCRSVVGAQIRRSHPERRGPPPPRELPVTPLLPGDPQGASTSERSWTPSPSTLLRPSASRNHKYSCHVDNIDARLIARRRHLSTHRRHHARATATTLAEHAQ